MDRQVAPAITGLLLTVCIMSLQFSQLNTQTDVTSCLLLVSYTATKLMIFHKQECMTEHI